jgi:hypothetical protein
MGEFKRNVHVSRWVTGAFIVLLTAVSFAVTMSGVIIVSALLGIVVELPATRFARLTSLRESVFTAAVEGPSHEHCPRGGNID